MRSIGIRTLQHHLAEILSWVEEGEGIQIKKWNKIVAWLVPSHSKKIEKKLMPNFLKRIRKEYPHTPIPDDAFEEIFTDMRKEKF